MVKDAETHADEDKKQLELVNARNQAEALAHSVKKSLGEYGDKIEASEKEKIEAAIKDLEGVLKDGDKGKIDAKVAGAGDGLAEAGREDLRRRAGEERARRAGRRAAGASRGRRSRKRRRKKATWSTRSTPRSRTRSRLNAVNRHSREGGNPAKRVSVRLGSRLRGNDA